MTARPLGLLLAGSLLAGALGLGWAGSRFPSKAAGGPRGSIPHILAAVFGGDDDWFSPKVIYEKEGLYHYIRVTESGGVRRLQFRRAGESYEESAIRIDEPLRFEMTYYTYMLAALAHKPDPRDILFVGLGGGTLSIAMARYFPEATIDNVELDPDVVHVAKEYFGLEEGRRMKVYVRDGRVQVRRFLKEKKKYDAIFLDAYRGGYIPYHLTTKEFMEQIRDLLREDGIVVSNLQTGFESYHYHRRTLASVFPNEWSVGDGNRIVVNDLRKKPRSQEELEAAAKKLREEKTILEDIARVVRRGSRAADYDKEGAILTDDYAPTEVLRGIPRE
ncbi:MAG: fused MFS/spermidine synthase [Planctomycetes bacterium]|nr:fused MFS/spermidine synthase [Planctomycetota bacterium]